MHNDTGSEGHPRTSPVTARRVRPIGWRRLEWAPPGARAYMVVIIITATAVVALGAGFFALLLALGGIL